MRKKLSFLILSDTGSPVKQLTVSRDHLRYICLGVAACLILLGFVTYDYLALKLTFNKKKIESKIYKQADEIISQRKQIQKFADEIAAHGYAPDAGQAVELLERLLSPVKDR